MNSSLVSYIKQSPNRNSPRNHTVDRITPHCYVGQVTVQDMAAWLCNTGAQASANYGIGKNGEVGLFVDETDRSWCSSSSSNDNRAITIECASDSVNPYAINDKVYLKLLDLMTDICKRYKKKRLIWFGDKDKTLQYDPKPDEMIITVHRWFANKACPGDYIYRRLPQIAAEVTRRLGTVEKTEIYTPAEWIAMISPIAENLYEKYHILPSVVIAQTCLETGFGKTDLTRKYNIVGMKADLINSTWKDHSTWDGTTYTKVTPEYRNGTLTYIDDIFRVYKSFQECLEDYVNFLLYVRNNKGYKYRRIQGLTDPASVIRFIRIGTGTDSHPEGYCTDPNYETKILSLIREYNLTQYDPIETSSETNSSKQKTPVTYVIYRVCVGTYKTKQNAEKRKQLVLTTTGYDCFLELVNNKYKVFCGSFSVKTNAEARVEELKKKDITNARIITVK